jgi:hypothetical protein
LSSHDALPMSEVTKHRKIDAGTGLQPRGGLRVLWIENRSGVIVGKGDGSLYRYEAETCRLTAIAVARLPIWRRLVGASRLGARLMRQTPRCMVVTSRGTIIWVAGGCIWRKPVGQPVLRSYVFRSGHGPLFLAESRNGDIYWGDYIARQVPQSSGVYRSSNDGLSWDEIHRFSTAQIRHVHGMFWDPESEAVCLTTGDDAHECALWRLEGSVPKVIVGGSSRFRIVQPVFTESHILFGTDVPGEPCHLYAVDRKTRQVDRLAAVRGPVFYGTLAGRFVVFSTVVEPLHPGDHAAIYVADRSDLHFSESLALKKDHWDMRLFQYGQVYLPLNNNPDPELWFSPCSTTNDGRLFRCRLN